MGTHFPSTGGTFAGADSMALLGEVVSLVAAEGLAVAHVDVTVIAQTVRVAPHREQMMAGLAEVLGIDASLVSVKATSTDGLGVIGRDEGIAALAVATLHPAAGR